MEKTAEAVNNNHDDEELLLRIATADKDIVVIDAALLSSCGVFC